MVGLLGSVAGNLLGRIIEAADRREFRAIRRELKNLETAVLDLKARLRDAEEKQASDPELYDQLRKLKHAFSMADSVIEELECDYLKWRVQNRKNDVDDKGYQFSSCFSSNFPISSCNTVAKFQQLTEELRLIEETMSKFSLVEDEDEYIKNLKGEMTLRTSITGSQAFARLLRLRKEAILSNVDSIFGRDKVQESIIKELVNDEQKSPRILSIQGDGGMGKTALAKLVYNADEVFDHFDKRIWVCVSEDFDIQRIIKEVLISATGENVTTVALTESRLRIRLQRYFFGKKILLVLDDFGNLDHDRVSELKEIVKMGVDGSKIMITTRSHKTPNVAATHKIDKLDKTISMQIFEDTFGGNELSNDVDLKNLVAECGGAPLAIKCLAGLLSSKPSDGANSPNVKDLSEKWKLEEANYGGGVSCALRLSYDLMPSYLKPFFLCFSLLPRDNVFFSFELIQLWLEQGFLPSGTKDDPEEIGEKYFKELWDRRLLVDVEEHTLGYWFKIHNLVHDLAVQKAEGQKNLGIFHQLSFVDCKSNIPPSTSYNDIHFLSIPVVGGAEPKINGDPLFKCITKFKQLRFLYLCNSSLEEIPTSIGTLKHLRCLDLRGSQRLKRLPESICKLQSLRTLILAFCSELEELPRNIKNLISLRFLWVQTKQASLGKDQIGSLTSLRFLAIGRSDNLTHLFEDIDKLNFLKTLIIYDCKSLLTLPKGLENVESLCNMGIWGCERLRFTFSLASLNLKKLILRQLTAVSSLPKWLAHLDDTLEVLEIGEFPTLRELPMWFSNYWELRILGISNCPQLNHECFHHELPIYRDKIEELRVTFCGSSSKSSWKKSMEEIKNKNPNISYIRAIYVDSKRIMPLEESTEKPKEAETKQDDANNNMSHVDIGLLSKIEQAHANNNVSHPGTKQPSMNKHDDANNNTSHSGIGLFSETKQEHANKNDNVNENETGKVCLGDNDHAEADQAMVTTYEGF
ncbi:putative disease resistance protein RGA3 isoform X3 [Cucumis melo var. makuwa]|uniref:Disease resistance protein RGA3 isoform X3 n=2 Tax=Cucumis melo TaxID=3656 RepID=A0A5A7UJY5_CUCMM|nr:putative disease resistance protein RGA3 isoform X3 [Cucumis melo var. makuwa]TYK25570.1 putative disease resistance protein RGA3 isoform X3 [Cucumis melo var. makuwa]